MEIKTKYEIGQRVWIVYKNAKGGTVDVYDDIINWITYDETGINYGLKDCCEDIRESDVILYEEIDKMVAEIKRLMKEIREEEGTNID